MSSIKSFLGETAIYGIGSMVSRFFAFVLIPVYISHLGKSAYANVILIQLTFTLITFFFALNSGVFFYYYEYKSTKLKQSIITSWLTYQIMTFLILSSVLYLFYPYISLFFDEGGSSENLKKAFLYMLMGLLPFIINNTYYNKCRIKRKPIYATLSVFFEAALLLVFVFLLLKQFDYGIEGVFLAQLIARSLVSIGLIIGGFWRDFYLKYISAKIIKSLLSYSWPFFITSSFFWLMNSIDKFMGTKLLESHEQVAFLALASQITLPIALFVDVIRQAFGPYVMSIRKEDDANKTYSVIFSFVIYVGVIISVGIIMLSPLLTNILADESFYPTLKVIPYFTIAATVNLAIGQFALGLNLTKNNIYIAIGVIIGGIAGFVLNYFLQDLLGLVGAGVAQVCSYLLSAVLIFFFSRKKMKIDYEFDWTFKVILILIIVSILVDNLNLLESLSIQLQYLVVTIPAIALLLILGNNKYQFIKKWVRKEY